LGALTLVYADSGRHYTDEDLSLAQDMARRAATAVQNARLHAEVRRASESKDEFLAMLAHELRNPLGAVKNGLELLERSREDPQQRERALAVLRRQVEHQARLVDDLLDVSRLTRGILQLHLERLDLVRLAREALEDHRPSLEAAGLEGLAEL